MKNIGKYSFGMGDRFAKEGKAQLQAILKAKEELNVEITPVWNKSNREHKTVHSKPESVRVEADEAVKLLNWAGPYFVDADHITLQTVDDFLDSSDFFTIDVAEYIGKSASEEEIEKFIQYCEKYLGKLSIPGIQTSFDITKESVNAIAKQFLLAAKEAGKVYDHISKAKGRGNFVAEVSMDEVDNPQTPIELFFILAALKFYGVDPDTIAPKFTGRFNKGVDYVGDLEQFAKEFEEDILVIKYAIKEFSLPELLKLSVHSGSDKFSIYPIIRGAIKKHNVGLHVKTAGTTWLEELIGLAMAENEGLEIAKEIYVEALDRFDELTGPYATVLDINKQNLPSVETVRGWSGDEYANALRHEQDHPDYNPDFRQLLHCSYKIAGEKGDRYLNTLEKFSDLAGRNVMENLYKRHIKRLFI